MFKMHKFIQNIYNCFVPKNNTHVLFAGVGPNAGGVFTTLKSNNLNNILYLI